MNRTELFKKIEQELKNHAEKYNIPDFENRYYQPACIEGNKINAYLYRFCENIVDRQYMANIIKFNAKKTGGKVILTELLDNFSVEKVLTYSDGSELFDNVRRLLTEKDRNITKYWTDIGEKTFSQKKWEEYCDNIYFIAQYLNSMTKLNGIDYFFKAPEKVDELKTMLFSMRSIISQKSMKGISTAIFCNCLKECGAVHFAKPDFHIKRVIAGMLKKVSVDSEIYDTEKDYDKIITSYLKKHQELREFPSSCKTHCLLNADEYAVVYMWEWAKETGVTPYKLDRILYLYCTNGYFYMDNNQSSISEKSLLDCIDADYIAER